MQKKLGLFVALLFLSVQVFSNLHMAKHGFAEHKHNGHVCDIYLHCEHSKIAGEPATDFSIDATFVTLAPLPFITVAISAGHRHSGAPRAPPAILLS